MDKQEAVEDNDPYSILSIFEIERITENTIEELPDQCKSSFCIYNRLLLNIL